MIGDLYKRQDLGIEESTLQELNQSSDLASNEFKEETDTIPHSENASLPISKNDVSEETSELTMDKKHEVLEKNDEPSVRRLSLFDTLTNENSESVPINKNEEAEKSEPIIESNDGASLVSEYSEDNNSENSLNEFDGEDRISSEEDEEFNQETEEELLDIPTFLRRQAN